MTMIDVSKRQPAIQSIYKYFAYEHLPDHLRPVSKIICLAANDMLNQLSDSPELTVGLRKLLEAKDCFVRAALPLILLMMAILPVQAEDLRPAPLPERHIETQEEFNARFKDEHPKWAFIAKWSGYQWTHNHILMPVDNWGVRHPGTVNIIGAGGGYANTAVTAAKRF